MLSSVARSVVQPIGRRAASTIATKYSAALYNSALAKNAATLDKVHADLTSVSSTLASSPDLGSVISNPTLSQNDRKLVLDSLFAKAQGVSKKESISELTKNLFYVLASNGRLNETSGVIENFNELVAEYKGELTVVVTSASPLTKDILTRLESTLKQSQAGQKAKTLKLTNKVNPSVLGGIVVDFGDKSVNLSVQASVTKLNQAIQQSV